MRRAVERKVRSRAQQIYESRGQMAGQELQDWFQAEAEVLENKLLAPMYRHMMKHGEQNEEGAFATGSADPSVALEITL